MDGGGLGRCSRKARTGGEAREICRGGSWKKGGHLVSELNRDGRKWCAER